MNEEQKRDGNPGERTHTPEQGQQIKKPSNNKENYGTRRFPRRDSNARGPRSAVLRSANRASFKTNQQNGQQRQNPNGPHHAPRQPFQQNGQDSMVGSSDQRIS